MGRRSWRPNVFIPPLSGTPSTVDYFSAPVTQCESKTWRRAARLWTLCAGLLAACESGRPSRNWSGRYATRVVESSTDCVNADAPPPMAGFILDLTQQTDGTATVILNPLIQLGGRFDGDRLEAQAVVIEPIGLPDSIAARARPADSLETITYRLVAGLSEDGFEGEYVVRSPDLLALVHRDEGARCDYRYELRGERLGEGPPAPRGTTPIRPGGSR